MNLDSPPILGSMFLLSYVILTNAWKGRYYNLHFTNERGELLKGSVSFTPDKPETQIQSYGNNTTHDLSTFHPAYFTTLY